MLFRLISYIKLQKSPLPPRHFPASMGHTGIYIYSPTCRKICANCQLRCILPFSANTVAGKPSQGATRNDSPFPLPARHGAFPLGTVRSPGPRKNHAHPGHEAGWTWCCVGAAASSCNCISRILTPVAANPLYRKSQFLHRYISDAWFGQ